MYWGTVKPSSKSGYIYPEYFSPYQGDLTEINKQNDAYEKTRTEEEAKIRRSTKENTGKPTAFRIQGRGNASSGLVRVREPACQDAPSASSCECAILRQASAVRAVCGKTARTDLCEGRRATAVPTATTHSGNDGKDSSEEELATDKAPINTDEKEDDGTQKVESDSMNAHGAAVGLRSLIRSRVRASRGREIAIRADEERSLMPKRQTIRARGGAALMARIGSAPSEYATATARLLAGRRLGR